MSAVGFFQELSIFGAPPRGYPCPNYEREESRYRCKGCSSYIGMIIEDPFCDAFPAFFYKAQVF